MSDQSYSYEGPIKFWDNGPYDGGSYFELDDGTELDQGIAAVLGINDEDQVNVRIRVEVGPQ